MTLNIRHTRTRMVLPSLAIATWSFPHHSRNEHRHLRTVSLSVQPQSISLYNYVITIKFPRTNTRTNSNQFQHTRAHPPWHTRIHTFSLAPSFPLAIFCFKKTFCLMNIRPQDLLSHEPTLWFTHKVRQSLWKVPFDLQVSLVAVYKQWYLRQVSLSVQFLIRTSSSINICLVWCICVLPDTFLTCAASASERGGHVSGGNYENFTWCRALQHIWAEHTHSKSSRNVSSTDRAAAR